VVQLTDQKLAMEMLLSTLGITAKTNFIHIKGMFDRIDKDKSGEVDGEELTRAHYSLCCLSMFLCRWRR
jgi:Ca2+-binding EF-hand superfamily protein